MYKHLQSIAAFVAVAETGAFNKAADKLGVQASVVSHHVSKLEEYLGATLVYRTTRKLSLSEHGRLLFEASRNWMDGTSTILEQIMDAQEEAIGSLNIALPSFVPDRRIEPAIMNFIKLHPHVSMSLNYSDEVADMLDDAFDLSIRVGEAPDSSFLTRKLSSTAHILVASQEFVLKHGAPDNPRGLADLPFVVVEGFGGQLALRRGSEEILYHVNARQLQTNNIYGALAAAQNGIGIANLPIALCEDNLRDGSLVKVLPNWHLPKLTLQAIWPDSSRRVTLTSRLVKHIVSTIKST